MRDPNFTIDYLWKKADFTPNDNQRAAILHTDGPLYLPAGPGSGKTRVLLWRTLNLIVFHDITPEEIYLSTFTEKAAHQLKEGLRSLLAFATNENGKPYDLGRMYIGTVHSLCQKLITDRRFSKNRDRQQRPVLLDELSQYFYISKSQKWEALINGVGFGEESEEIRLTINIFLNKRTSSKHETVVNVRSFFNRLSEEHLDPAQFKKNKVSAELFSLLTMYARYKNSLLYDSVVPQTDFSLLQQEAFNILKSHSGSGSVFKHVIIDEYQDTNTIQEKIFFELTKGSKNICVVGDDDQALYRFRGATVENFVNFPDKCLEVLAQSPRVIPLDINYRSRESIVTLYSDFMKACAWSDPKNPKQFYRVNKEIKAHRKDKQPAVVASKPAPPEEACEEVANFVKKLLKTGKVQNENQIAFLFPSLKTDQVTRFKNALEKLGLKVYAPRAGKFIEVDESTAVFGVLLHILGKPLRGGYPGQDYNNYFDWIDTAHATAKALIKEDKGLAAFVEDKRTEVETSIKSYQLLLKTITKKGWQLDQPYDIELMKRPMAETPGISEASRKSITNGYFDKVVISRRRTSAPVLLSYALTRATSLDWTVLDLFYRLCSFNHFKEMFDLAESGEDEGPICNLSLISQYLSKFMDEYRSVITAESLQENKYQQWLFGSYLYVLYRLSESEYEDAEDPFPKGRIPFLTVHQAKGLEFPVVVFGNPRKQARTQKMETIVNPLLNRKSEPLEKAAEFDLMRLFYVALSRAKNLLIIPEWAGNHNYVSKPLSKLLDDTHVARISSFDIDTVPAATEEESDLSKNYSFTSDYLLYQKCPRQYMIFRKYGFVPSRSQTMFFGSLVHRTLEDLHQHLIALKEGSL